MSQQIIPETVNVGTFPDNEPFNVAQVAGSTSGLTGNGVVSTATLRVTVAGDSTGQIALAPGSVVQANAGTGDFLSIAAHTRNEAFKEAVAIGGELDDTATTAATEGNVSPVRITDTRAFHVNLRGATGNEFGLTGSPVAVQGITDHDANIAGILRPFIVGGQAETMADSAPGVRVSADVDAQRIATTDGAQYVIPTGPQTWTYHSNGSAALLDASVHATPGAGLSLYVQTIVFSSGAATAINIFFEEGAVTILGPWYLEAVAGRGLVVNFPGGRKISTATALTVTTSAAIAHSVDVTGFIAPG